MDLAITDLAQARTLNGASRARIRGAAGAPFVYGWIRPYLPATPAAAMPAMNFYQINNTSIFYAEQVNNQFQTIEINNSAANATLTAVLVGSQAA